MVVIQIDQHDPITHMLYLISWRVEFSWWEWLRFLRTFISWSLQETQTDFSPWLHVWPLTMCYTDNNNYFYVHFWCNAVKSTMKMRGAQVMSTHKSCCTTHSAVGRVWFLALRCSVACIHASASEDTVCHLSPHASCAGSSEIWMHWSECRNQHGLCPPCLRCTSETGIIIVH